MRPSMSFWYRMCISYETQKWYSFLKFKINTLAEQCSCNHIDHFWFAEFHHLHAWWKSTESVLALDPGFFNEFACLASCIKTEILFVKSNHLMQGTLKILSKAMPNAIFATVSHNDIKITLQKVLQAMYRTLFKVLLWFYEILTLCIFIK